MIQRGNIYWVTPTEKNRIPASVVHPYVVIEMNITDESDSVIVCALTTNMNKVSIAGNVLLELGEANLPKQSIVEVSKRFTLQMTELGDYMGTLSQERLEQIYSGIQFVERSFLK
ncbi:MAG: type II toxin-antitoxin system PemK/MazF family toxin [Chloroflexota bacterium]